MFEYVKDQSVMDQLVVERPMKWAGMEEKALEASTLLAAMANPVRLMVLCALLDGEKPVHELVAQSGISQSAVSQHLAKMRNLKLVTTRRDAQSIYYSLASPDVRRVLSTLYDIYCA
jgi:ArsR family transcriptional regulator, virulence genes transcriptional regulator